jgi:hypothetical protein
MDVNKYKLKVAFQLKMLATCQHHINCHFKFYVLQDLGTYQPTWLNLGTYVGR